MTECLFKVWIFDLRFPLNRECQTKICHKITTVEVFILLSNLWIIVNKGMFGGNYSKVHVGQ